MPTSATIYPSLCYDDALAAIEWLCTSFGFRLRLLVRDDEDGVRHSELSLGPGVIMVSSLRPAEGRQSPCHLGFVTQSLDPVRGGSRCAPSAFREGGGRDRAAAAG